jgi:hypothetical protein
LYLGEKNDRKERNHLYYQYLTLVSSSERVSFAKRR